MSANYFPRVDILTSSDIVAIKIESNDVLYKESINIMKYLFNNETKPFKKCYSTFFAND